MSDGMGSLRCTTCGVSWPNDCDLYQPCPQCLKKTDSISGAPSLSEVEALSIKRHADFDRFCVEWDKNPIRQINELESIPTQDVQDG